MSADPKQVRVLLELEHDAPLMACRFDPAGRWVVATGEDRNLIRWDLSSENPPETKTIFTAHDSWVRALAFTPDGATLISGGFDDTLAWWTIADAEPKPVRTIRAHDGWIRAVAVSPDGTRVASAGNDRVVRLWHSGDGSPAGEFHGHDRDVYSLLFHPDGRWLLSGDLKGAIVQRDLDGIEESRVLDASELNTYNGGQQVDYGGVRSLSLSPDGSQLAAFGLHKATNPLGSVNEPLVVRFDWSTGAIAMKQVAEGITKSAGWRAVFHPDGFLIGCSGGNDGGHLHFWNGDEEKPFHQFKLKETARDLDLHPDGLRIATAHYDRQLRISTMEPAPEATA